MSSLPPAIECLRAHLRDIVDRIQAEITHPLALPHNGGSRHLLDVLSEQLEGLSRSAQELETSLNGLGKLLAEESPIDATTGGLVRLARASDALLGRRRDACGLVVHPGESEGLRLLVEVFDHVLRDFMVWAQGVVCALDAVERCPPEGPLTLQFRCELTPPPAAGVLLKWAEYHRASRAQPRNGRCEANSLLGILAGLWLWKTLGR